MYTSNNKRQNFLPPINNSRKNEQYYCLLLYFVNQDIINV